MTDKYADKMCPDCGQLTVDHKSKRTICQDCWLGDMAVAAIKEHRINTRSYEALAVSDIKEAKAAYEGGKITLLAYLTGFTVAYLEELGFTEEA